MKKKYKFYINSYEELERIKRNLEKSLTPEERLSEIQICREQYFKMKGIDESRKRLRRVFKIIKQK